MRSRNSYSVIGKRHPWALPCLEFSAMHPHCAKALVSR